MRSKTIKWDVTWQNQQNECAPSEDSDQPWHPPSLIRVFAVRMQKPWVLSYPLSAQRRLWSDWVDVFTGCTLILLVLSFRSSNTICNKITFLLCVLKGKLGRVKRICVFEHSVMTNFNCACPVIQRGQGSGFLSEGSSWLMNEQRRFWRDCADAQARLNLRCSHRL